MTKPRLTKALVVVAAVLALPILPALLAGEFFGDTVASWLENPPPKTVIAGAAAAVLAADIFLPVPSGPINTLAGAQLGPVLATAVCWFGMTLGAIAAFALAKWFGPRLVTSFATQADLDALLTAWRGRETMVLFTTRPLPVMAEAAVLLAGLVGVPFHRFLPAIALGNVVVAAIYSLAGHYAASSLQLGLALLASMLAPIAGTAIVRVWFRNSSHP
ncbi:MAG: VTT domain-containing protein [Planctomycetota bacterium]